MEKKIFSILSLTFTPNLCERMEKKNSLLSLTLAPNLRERTEKKFHPLTGIGGKIVRGWNCSDLSCM
jgi:hypothetical protein